MIQDNFKFDGHLVNFYQIMGSNIQEILEQEQKHKYVRIAGIRLQHPTKEVSILVDSKDRVECTVINTVDERFKMQKQLSDTEIKEEHEEHYTWMIPR
ncbi:MAG: hypothetical protein AAFZ63_20675 [Bacteroidota bacterium]